MIESDITTYMGSRRRKAEQENHCSLKREGRECSINYLILAFEYRGSDTHVRIQFVFGFCKTVLFRKATVTSVIVVIYILIPIRLC